MFVRHFNSDDGENAFLQNVDSHLQDFTVLQPTKSENIYFYIVCRRDVKLYHTVVSISMSYFFSNIGLFPSLCRHKLHICDLTDVA